MLRLAAALAPLGLAAAQTPGQINAVCHFQPTTQEVRASRSSVQLATAAVDGPSTRNINARAQVEGSGLSSGVMYLTYTPGVGTETEVETSGMTEGLHGIHIHDWGDLSNTETGTSTGPHYNPLDEIHGCYPTERKVGDMGNVIVNATGDGYYAERSNELIFLDGSISVIGRATILHALEDNCVREEGPGGDLSAGARIGFCVIGYEQEEDEDRAAHRAYIREQYAKAKLARGEQPEQEKKKLLPL